MPELPEVETLRQGLLTYLRGHIILDVEVRDQKIFLGDTKKIRNLKVEGIERVGKGLVIQLSKGYALAVHIKLTGQLVYQGPKARTITISKEKVGTLPSQFTRVIFHLDKNATLYYNDIRRFGWIKLIKQEELRSLPFFKEMGPEPLKDLTKDKFRNILAASRSPIKALLMDQQKIGGVGNIYANEALFEAKIDPRKRSQALSREEADRLYHALLTVLKRGLKYGGSSEISFVNALGQEGKYQNHTLVYGRDGKSCKRCGSSIKKIKLSGRGTYFCPRCQK